MEENTSSTMVARPWDRQLTFLTNALNSAYSPVLKDRPFYLMFGRDSRLPTEEILQCQTHYAGPQPLYDLTGGPFLEKLVKRSPKKRKSSSSPGTSQGKSPSPGKKDARQTSSGNAVDVPVVVSPRVEAEHGPESVNVQEKDNTDVFGNQIVTPNRAGYSGNQGHEVQTTPTTSKPASLPTNLGIKVPARSAAAESKHLFRKAKAQEKKRLAEFDRATLTRRSTVSDMDSGSETSGSQASLTRPRAESDPKPPYTTRYGRESKPVDRLGIKKK